MRGGQFGWPGRFRTSTNGKWRKWSCGEALEEIERLTERLRAENIYLQEEITNSQGFDEIVGQSELLRSTLSKIEHVAGTDASVLLLGETGTGKELFARAIHNRSPRKDRPLVKVNLAALPSSLIESELFGHVKGAFTGAVSDKVGRFELADGGTLFLDEIGELDPELQTKLLRVLAGRRIRENRLCRDDPGQRSHGGGHQPQSSQGHRRGQVSSGPVLSPRRVSRSKSRPFACGATIFPCSSGTSSRRNASGWARRSTTFPLQVMKALVEYDWPGNVRELENVIERAMILSHGSTLVLEESFQPARRPAAGDASAQWQENRPGPSCRCT